jgi:CheY-like chemotaxis protein
MNILIIEDEFLIAKSLSKILENEGHVVQTTPSGSAAISLIANQDFDRIVCDLMLQDISGFDVIEESKKKYNMDQIKSKFIIMTAYNSPQVMERAQAYECEVLQKPFNSLRFAIKSILGVTANE